MSAAGETQDRRSRRRASPQEADAQMLAMNAAYKEAEG